MKAAGLHGSTRTSPKQELQRLRLHGQEVPETALSEAQRGRRAYATLPGVRHRDNPGYGCTMAALGSEVARSTPELKATFERGLEEILAASGGDREDAIFQTAALLGGVVLARAVKDSRLSDEILESVRHKLN